MKIREVIKQVGAAGLTVFGTISTAAQLFGASVIHADVLLLGGLAPLLVGGFSLRYLRKKHVLRIKEEEQRYLLRLFAENGSSLGLAQIALLTEMPFDKIEERVDDLQKRGALEVSVTHAGAVVYQVPELSGIENRPVHFVSGDF